MTSRPPDEHPAATPGSSSLSAGRRRFLALVVGVVVYALVELLAFAAFWISDGRPFLPSRLRAERETASGDQPAGRAQADLSVRGSQFMVVHPYLGFVMDPAQAQQGLGQFVNDFGFAKTRPGPIFKRGKDRVLIGIVGGSVAQILAYNADVLLKPHLEKAPAFAGKELVFIVLANGGYKQPQQLLTLSYVLALGGELDVLLNVDGVNDISLAAIENTPRGVHPLFPRDWDGLARGLPQPRAQLLLGRAAFWRDLRGRWARLFGRAPLRYSVTAQFVWRAGHRFCDNAAAANLARARELERDGTPFYVSGPKAAIANEDQLHAELASAWARCSLQLHRLSAANGIKYLHFLQPNQYLPGSKPIGDAERRIAVNPASPFKPHIERGYPLLQGAGRELLKQGILFKDLSGLFAGLQEPAYTDDCCHYNALGNGLLGLRIAESVIAAVS